MAITLQIVLSFGHAHRFDVFRPGALSLRLVAAAPDQPAAEPGAPASKPGKLAFEYCAICAVIEMGASAVPPATATHLVAVAASRVRFAAYAESTASTLERLPFEARGPPSV